MGLFSNPRNNKDKWASIVMAGSMPGSMISEETLIVATDLYLKQRIRIFYESVHLVVTTKNDSTRKSRFKLAKKQFEELIGVKKYCDKEQKKAINQVIDDFLKVEDVYKHPHRAEYQAKQKEKQRKRDEFWEAYGMMEMIDIFAGDDD